MTIILKYLLLLIITFQFFYGHAKATENNEVMLEIYNDLNLASFRNSTGPNRSGYDKYFSDLGLSLTNVDKKYFEVETKSWMYRVELTKIGDANSDGVKDYSICFYDNAKQGSYSTKQSLLISKFNGDFGLVAMKFEVDAC